MLDHHKDSIKNLTNYYKSNPAIKALFLIGSVATETARPDSDLDAVAIVSAKEMDARKKNGTALEVVLGHCTYEGGYFDIHYHSREELEEIAQNGSEPLRNMFTGARVLFCHEPGLPELAAQIPAYPKAKAAERQFRFYCTFKMYYSYFWAGCKPTGHARFHVANGMIYCLYRLILIENEILFPSVRKLEATVKRAPNKPKDIERKCQLLIDSLSDEARSNEACLDLVTSYESWTAYDYPKDHNTVMNNFSDPYEWD